MRLHLLLISFLMFALPAFAVDSDSTVAVVRPVLSSYSLEIGSAHQCDTYLTPLHYSGWQTAFDYERMQAMRHDPDRNVMALGARLSVARTLNQAGTAAMWSIALCPRWAMMWRYRVGCGFTLAGGGGVAASIGAVSLMRNGNNPVSARAAITAGITGMAVWNGSLGHLPVTIFYRPSMPLIGAFFSPDYDELYYEIWLGNHKGLCHAAWPGSYFRLDNQLAADLHFGATTLRIGYRCDITSTKAAGIVSRDITHAFVIGVTAEWISLRAGSRRTPDARIISALYE
ncbi:MAG: DUF3316 domain-containing protein [Bacteroidales bacterium]|nr:DUF3316 domain-containing protein [Bacteroidales bacterium]